MAKRNPQDRRCREGRTKFPFRDAGGELVREDRRRLADRRLSGIEVEWLEMVHESGYEPAPALTPGNPQEGQDVPGSLNIKSYQRRGET